MRYLGVDLHTNSFTVCYLTGNRNRLKTYRLKELLQFKRGLRESDILAVEATGNTRYFVESVLPSISGVSIVNPKQFSIIRKSVKKTDKNDAKSLAYFLSKDMLPEVRMKSKKQAQISSLVGTRDKLVKLRTSLFNKIHNIFNSYGINIKKESLSTRKGLDSVLGYCLDDTVELELSVITDQIRGLNEGVKKLDKEIEQQGKNNFKGHENLTSIKGIGDKAATILLSVIGDVNDFKTEHKLAAYFGIVPRVSQSNDHVHYGRITKWGSKIGRTTLVQCTLIAIRYSPYLRKFYDRIKSRKGSGKAIIATARKFLGIIYNTLKNNWIFEDFPNFVLAN